MVWAQSTQCGFDAECLGAAFAFNVEVLLEKPDRLIACRQQYLPDGINDAGLARIVLTNKDVEPRIELPAIDPARFIPEYR